MDIKSIKSLIASSPPASALISGVKTNTVGQNVSFQLLHGWDIALAHKCDTEWTAKNIEILRCVQSSVASEEELLKKYLICIWRTLTGDGVLKLFIILQKIMTGFFIRLRMPSRLLVLYIIRKIVLWMVKGFFT